MYQGFEQHARNRWSRRLILPRQCLGDGWGPPLEHFAVHLEIRSLMY